MVRVFTSTIRRTPKNEECFSVFSVFFRNFGIFLQEKNQEVPKFRENTGKKTKK